ncbi:MAG: hypothetical protein HDT42_05745 [Ruminococcaceae bacterium]|nr:hypothetical protein [Oscillospiraceae bacterium]
MKKQAKFLAIILGISCLCGCSGIFGNNGKLDEINTPDYQIVDYSVVKEGYYLSDSGDGSYYFIKDGKFTLVGYDWEKDFRSREPIEGVSYPEKGTSEYEEFISRSVEDAIEERTNTPFTPVKYDRLDIYVKLVTLPSPEEIASNGFDGSALGPHMKDENTIGTEPPFYIYCGTSLPESE